MEQAAVSTDPKLLEALGNIILVMQDLAATQHQQALALGLTAPPPPPATPPAMRGFPAPNLTFGELWDQYARLVSPSLPGWKKRHEAHCSIFLNWRPEPTGPMLREMHWSQITVMLVIRFQSYLATDYRSRRHNVPLAPGSRNLIFTALKACFRKMFVLEQIPYDPVAAAKKEQEPPARSSTVSEAQLKRLNDHAHPTLRLIMTVAWEQGMRRGEVLTLRKSQVVKRQVGETGKTYTFLILPGKGRKNRRECMFPLSKMARKAIEQAPGWPIESTDYLFPNPLDPHNPIPNTTLWTWFDKARTASGVTGVGDEKIWLHTMRHSYGSDMSAMGATWQAVKAGGGWLTDAAASRYQHLQPETILQLVRAMEARRGPKRAAPPSQDDDEEDDRSVG